MAQNENSGPGVGFEYPPVKVTWNKRDLLLFAYSVGSFQTESEDTTDFRAIENALPPIPGVPRFSPFDGLRSLKILKSLPLTSKDLPNSSISIHKTVLGAYDKGDSGSVLKVLHRLIDDTTGDVHIEIVVTSFYIRRGNWGGA
ncbi:hypothetical protein ACMFMF_004723 [Clarireedia jacksonii]